jgi:asparagine synthase (glutamine-hydrolysing)
VALTGDAGDELFGGYDRYRALALTGMLEGLPRGPRRVLAGTVTRVLPGSARAKTRLRAVRRLVEGLGDPPLARYARWMTTFDEARRTRLYSDEWLDRLAGAAARDPDEADPASVLARAWDAAARRDPVTRAMIGDMLTYLPDDLNHKVDMASMAHGLECRGPFMDHRVVELALAMPLDRKLRLKQGRGKVVLREAFGELLPDRIKRRSKMGFGVPIDRWFRGPLKEEIRAVLSDPAALGRGLFREQEVQALLREHEGAVQDHAYRLWALMMLEHWFRRHLDATRRRG